MLHVWNASQSASESLKKAAEQWESLTQTKNNNLSDFFLSDYLHNSEKKRPNLILQSE